MPGSDQSATLDRVVRVDLIEKETFEQILEDEQYFIYCKVLYCIYIILYK